MCSMYYCLKFAKDFSDEEAKEVKRLTDQNLLDELDEFSKQAIWKAR